ncbi:MAG: hypothetical protein CMJ70_05995 [Planctomycetaceae bacterium]|nr:hypothetical protein [Planctomycetaceae bacterium]HAA69561.1 hypothetical protein [Planctomycetaceae bacterium]
MRRIDPQISPNEKHRRISATRSKWSVQERVLRSERARQLHLASNDSKLPWLTSLLQQNNLKLQDSVDPVETSH